MRAKYRNSIRSKQMIRDAFISLMDKNKNIADITVSDIAKEANINRGTFYNHYDNPVDIIEEIKDEIMSKLFDAMKVSSIQRDVDGFVDILITHFKKNENEYRKMVSFIPMSIFDQMKRELVRQISSLGINIDEISLYFVVNGIAGLYVDCLKNNVQIDYPKLETKTKEFIKKNISI